MLTLKFGDGIGVVPLLIAVAFEQGAAHVHEAFRVEGEGLEDRPDLLLEHLLARARLRELSLAPARPLSLTRESRRSSPPQVRHSP